MNEDKSRKVNDLKNCRWRAFQWVDEFTREKPVAGRIGKTEL